MLHSKDRRQKTVSQNLKGVLAILLIVLAVYTAGSAMLLKKSGDQMMREINEISGLYTNEIDNRFFRISRRLFSTMTEKNQPDSVFWQYVDKLKEDSANSDYAVNKLREKNLSYVWEYGAEYQFFLYLDDTPDGEPYGEGRYYKLSLTERGGYDETKDLEEAVLNQIRMNKDKSYYVKKKWSIMTSGDENYMCKVAQNGDVYFGCYVNVNSILKPFYRIVTGEEGYVGLVDENEKVVGELTSEGITPAGNRDKEKDKYSVIKDLKQAPFQIRIRIGGERIRNMFMGSLVILVLLAVAIIAAAISILFYLKNSLLRPIQHFISDLENYDDGEYTFNLTEGKLLELEQIDNKFKHMLHQIRRLKITLYEQELEKQKMEMEYLKLQIRPHFYLNCLNFIYSMIDFEQYDNARKMTKTTSNYLHYVFRNTSELVPVKAEAKHCEDYLSILALRYPKSFDYYIEVHEEVEDAAIFPFLIQIFVENAAKHALTLEDKILISVTIYPEDREDGSYVNIYVSDTGKGFPEETLSILQQGKSVAHNGEHLGIENCLKRFRYYYKEQGEIRFENSTIGGAIVDIHIPYIQCDHGS